MTAPVNPRSSTRTFASVTVTTAATGLSDSVNLTGLTLSSIQMATAWTDAGIGFQGNTDGSTNFFDVTTTANTPLVFTTTASKLIVFDPAQFAALQVIRLVSESTAGSAIAQAAERVIKLGLTKQDVS